eukprot:GHVO01018283.1.p1 GENE.GHVO01018283.1~~GHVO01018283.1.p1  ORF type:complete len:794 (+),score=140.14 GHVO01018283.1:276-2384(+)
MARYEMRDFDAPNRGNKHVQSSAAQVMSLSDGNIRNMLPLVPARRNAIIKGADTYGSGSGMCSPLLPWSFGLMDGHGVGGREAAKVAAMAFATGACEIIPQDILKSDFTKCTCRSGRRVVGHDEASRNSPTFSPFSPFITPHKISSMHNTTTDVGTTTGGGMYNAGKYFEEIINDEVNSKTCCLCKAMNISLRLKTVVDLRILQCDRIARGFNNAHNSILKINKESNRDFGSTCVAASLMGRFLMVGNCGDSSAYLILPPKGSHHTGDGTAQKGGVMTIALSESHTLYNKHERTRIMESGKGSIVMGDGNVLRLIPEFLPYSSARLQGLSINMSRSLGHMILSECSLSPEPEYTVIDLLPFLVETPDIETQEDAPPSLDAYHNGSKPRRLERVSRMNAYVERDGETCSEKCCRCASGQVRTPSSSDSFRTAKGTPSPTVPIHVGRDPGCFSSVSRMIKNTCLGQCIIGPKGLRGVEFSDTHKKADALLKRLDTGTSTDESSGNICIEKQVDTDPQFPKDTCRSSPPAPPHRRNSLASVPRRSSQRLSALRGLNATDDSMVSFKSVQTETVQFEWSSPETDKYEPLKCEKLTDTSTVFEQDKYECCDCCPMGNLKSLGNVLEKTRFQNDPIYLVMLSDGVTDVIAQDTIGHMVYDTKGTADQIASKLTMTAENKRREMNVRADNCTAVVVRIERPRSVPVCHV